MAVIRVVGLDPSMANFGMVSGVLNMKTGVFDLEVLRLVETKASKLKQTRKNSDDLERAKQHFSALTDMVKKADLVCVEIPVGSQTARAMCSYGMCIGLLASINVPMIQVTPSEVKRAATGNKNATKGDMIDWALTQYPQAKWFSTIKKGFITYSLKNEHLADAVATIHAGVLTDDFKVLKLLYRGQT